MTQDAPASPLSITDTPLWKRVGFVPLPLSAWLLLGAVALAVAGGFSQAEVVERVNAGFGRALGDFALLLLPAFVMAGCLAKRGLGGASGFAAGVSPLMGAGMVCPDTAYATLAPLAGRRRLATALGAYAGFKLLFPAGPLIVATGLGLASPAIYAWGLLFVPVAWAAGLVMMRVLDNGSDTREPSGAAHRLDPIAFIPFGVLAGLLVLGATTPLGALPPIDFLLHPRGALLAAAFVALVTTPLNWRAEILAGAVRRTAGLLFMIGAATALGAILTTLIPVASLWPTQAGPVAAVILLFSGAMAFKLIQGSSMATFAAVTAVAGPVVAVAGLAPAAAVYAICLGTLVAVTPNDSFYWLVRSDALVDRTETAALRLLGLTTLAQGIAGLAVLVALVATGSL